MKYINTVELVYDFNWIIYDTVLKYDLDVCMPRHATPWY